MAAITTSSCKCPSKDVDSMDRIEEERPRNAKKEKLHWYMAENGVKRATCVAPARNLWMVLLQKIRMVFVQPSEVSVAFPSIYLGNETL